MMKQAAMVALLLLGAITGNANAKDCAPVYYCDYMIGCVYIGDYCCDWSGCYFEEN